MPRLSRTATCRAVNVDEAGGEFNASRGEVGSSRQFGRINLEQDRANRQNDGDLNTRLRGGGKVLEKPHIYVLDANTGGSKVFRSPQQIPVRVVPEGSDHSAPTPAVALLGWERRGAAPGQLCRRAQPHFCPLWPLAHFLAWPSPHC